MELFDFMKALTGIFLILLCSNVSEPSESANTPIPSSMVYPQAADIFPSTLNESRSPCDNFYEYTTCDKYRGRGVQDEAQTKVVKTVVEALRSSSGKYNNACVATKSNHSSVIDSALVVSLVKKFAEETGLPFPLVDGGKEADWPNGTSLGRALGSLTRTFSSNPLFSSKVVPNYLDPEGAQPYYLFIGNVFPRQTLRTERNEGRQVNDEAPGGLLETYANLIGRNISKDQLSEEEKEIERLSTVIDAMLSKTAAGSVNFHTAFNPISLVDADAAFGELINFTEFMSTLTAASSNDLKERVHGQEYNISLNSMDYFGELKGLLHEGNEPNIKPSTFYNFLYNWVLSQYSGLFVAPTTEISVDQQGAFNKCVASTAISSMPFASGRVYLDTVLPTKKAREELRRKVELMTGGIIAAFQSMIDEIDWMTDASKSKAYDKLKNIVKNVAYPDFVEDDQLLAEYYRDFDVQSAKGNWELAQLELQRFTLQKQLDDLARSSVDRTRFAVPMNEIQAIYMPSLNSINIPLAFLQQPFFDQHWPASLNFGGIGATIGHEITHGFDTNGVKWDSIGRISPWLDDESQKAFDKMASCVIGEYDKFCFNAQNTTQCLSGNATKAENIADNGGTRAAYRAYLNEVGVNGSDPLLPGPYTNQTDQFDQNQMFFLNFAHSWCASAETAESNYDGVHSSPKFRVFGTLQNFEAFRAVFNCPLGSRYAPEKHCNVWTSKSSSEERVTLLST